MAKGWDEKRYAHIVTQGATSNGLGSGAVKTTPEERRRKIEEFGIKRGTRVFLGDSIESHEVLALYGDGHLKIDGFSKVDPVRVTAIDKVRPSGR